MDMKPFVLFVYTRSSNSLVGGVLSKIGSDRAEQSEQRSCFPDQSRHASLHHPGLPRSLAACVGRLRETQWRNDTGIVSDDQDDLWQWWSMMRLVVTFVDKWKCDSVAWVLLLFESVRLEHLRYMVLDEAGAVVKFSSYTMWLWVCE